MIKTCNYCGAIYKLRFTRTIMRDKDFLSCLCGKTVHSWNEAKIWEMELLERKGCESNHKK